MLKTTKILAIVTAIVAASPSIVLAQMSNDGTMMRSGGSSMGMSKSKSSMMKKHKSGSMMRHNSGMMKSGGSMGGGRM